MAQIKKLNIYKPYCSCLEHCHHVKLWKIYPYTKMCIVEVDKLKLTCLECDEKRQCYGFKFQQTSLCVIQKVYIQTYVQMLSHFFFSHFINDAKIDLITFSSCIRLFTILRSDNLIIAITWQPSSRSRGLWQNAVWSQNRFNTVKGHYKMCSDTLICPNKTYIHFQNSFFSIIKDYYENRMWIADNTNKLKSIPCLNFIDIFSAPKHTVYIRSF